MGQDLIVSTHNRHYRNRFCNINWNPRDTTERTKHVDLNKRHVRELINIIVLSHVRTTQQPAEILTKPPTR